MGIKEILNRRTIKSAVKPLGKLIETIKNAQMSKSEKGLERQREKAIATITPLMELYTIYDDDGTEINEEKLKEMEVETLIELMKFILKRLQNDIR